MYYNAPIEGKEASTRFIYKDSDQSFLNAQHCFNNLNEVARRNFLVWTRNGKLFIIIRSSIFLWLPYLANEQLRTSFIFLKTNNSWHSTNNLGSYQLDLLAFLLSYYEVNLYLQKWVYLHNFYPLVPNIPGFSSSHFKILQLYRYRWNDKSLKFNRFRMFFGRAFFYDLYNFNSFGCTVGLGHSLSLVLATEKKYKVPWFDFQEGEIERRWNRKNSQDAMEIWIYAVRLRAKDLLLGNRNHVQKSCFGWISYSTLSYFY